MNVSQQVFANLGPFIHAMLQAVDRDAQRRAGGQHHRPMYRRPCAECHRKPHDAVMIHDRRLDDASVGKRHQGDNSGFDEINRLDCPLGFLQHAALFQRDSFEKRIDAIVIARREAAQKAVSRKRRPIHIGSPSGRDDRSTAALARKEVRCACAVDDDTIFGSGSFGME